MIDFKYVTIFDVNDKVLKRCVNLETANKYLKAHPNILGCKVRKQFIAIMESEDLDTHIEYSITFFPNKNIKYSRQHEYTGKKRFPRIDIQTISNCVRFYSSESMEHCEQLLAEHNFEIGNNHVHNSST